MLVNHPYSEITDGNRTFRATRPEYLTLNERGHVYLHTRYVDVILNGVPFPRYHHDGAGGILLTGNFGDARLKVPQAKARFEHIEAWRVRKGDYPQEVEMADRCMESLLEAIDQAERYAPADVGVVL